MLAYVVATTGPSYEIEFDHWAGDTFRGTLVSPLRLGVFAVSSTSTVERCLVSPGQESTTIIEEAQSQSSKEELRSRTQEATRLGIFGALSFLIGRELFCGNDRLEDALEWHMENSAQ